MSFLDELKRRNVYRVGIAYLAASWIALQLADVVLENLDVPGWVFKALLVAIVVGFPIALIVAWAYELTPDGVRRDSGRRQPAEPSRGQYVQLAIIAVLAVAVGWLAVDKFRGDTADAPAAAPVERSVAVLPFANRSANADDAFFVDGMQDYILTQLAKLATMDKVISQGSAAAYRGTEKSMREIGAELGVATVLTGAFQRAGPNVRINMRLYDAVSEETLWADSWDKELTLDNLFAIQTEITRDVVTALQGALTDEDRTQLARMPTTSVAAYEQYVLGRNEMAKRTAPALSRALEHFERAVDIDPGYALAWVSVADVHYLLTIYADVAMEASMAPRRRAIDKALALDPLSGEAYAALAELRKNEGETVAAEQYFERAIELNPNYATARHWYALFLRDSGRIDKAVRQIEKARDMDPGSAIISVASVGILVDAGRFDEAAAVARDGIRRNPDFAALYGAQALPKLARGEFADALRWVDEAVRRAPSAPDLRSTQCYVLAQLDLVAESAQCLDRLARDFSEQYVRGQSPTDLALGVLSGNIAALLVPPERVAALPGPARLGIAAAWFLAGDNAAAREIIAAERPQLFETPPPEIAVTDLSTAMIASSLLYQDDEPDAARALLDAVEASKSNAPGRRGGAEFIPVVSALAREDYAEAADALRQALADGRIASWWIFRAPAFADARAKTAFAAALADVEAEIARQREAYLADPSPPMI